MKKLLLLICALLGLGASGAWAQTPLSSISDVDEDKVYTISAYVGGSWMYDPNNPFAVLSTGKGGYAPSGSDTKQQWAFVKVSESYYLYNVGTKRFATSGNTSYLSLTPFAVSPVTLQASTHASKATYPAVVTFNGSRQYGISNGYTYGVFQYNNLGDQGNAAAIVAVGDFSAAAKTEAQTIAANAGAPVATTLASDIKYLNIWNIRSAKKVQYSSGGTELVQEFANNQYSAFFLRSVDGGYYIYSATNGLPIKDVSKNSVTFGTSKDDATKYYIYSSTQGGFTGYVISTSSTVTSNAAWNDQAQSSVTKWKGDDGGSIWRFGTSVVATNALSTLRTEINNCIDNYVSLGATEEAKNALKTVYDEPFSSVAELEAALTAFYNSITPVFRIKSGHSGYAANSYIYKNAVTGEFKWDSSTDIKDFALVRLESTSGVPYRSTTSVVAGTYSIIELYTGNKWFDVTVAEVPESGGQFTLGYGGSYWHAQESGKALVTWAGAEARNPNGASTWTFEYVDNIDNLDLEIARAETRYLYNYMNYSRTYSTDYGDYNTGVYNLSDMVAAKVSLNVALQNPEAAYTSLSASEPSVTDYTTMYQYLNSYATPYASSIAVNVPKAGDFLRIKASATNKSKDYSLSDDLYLTSSNYENLVSSSYRAEFALGEATDNTTIFYYSGSKLTGLANGQQAFMNAKSQFQIGDVGATATVVTFESINGTENKAFRIEFNNGVRSLYTGRSASAPYSYYTDAAGGDQTGEHYRYFLEKVTSLPVTITAAGYATLYSPVALTIPGGITAYVATEDVDNKLRMTPISDGIIPAECGVVLKGAEGSYDFDITTGGTATSLLKGDVATITKPTNAYYLSSGSSGIGFYKGGSAETLAGFKAYYEAAGGVGVKQFIFDEADAVKNLDARFTHENAIFNLAGQRMNKLQRGVNIVNGKKIIVK